MYDFDKLVLYRIPVFFNWMIADFLVRQNLFYSYVYEKFLCYPQKWFPTFLVLRTTAQNKICLIIEKAEDEVEKLVHEFACNIKSSIIFR